MKQTEVKFNSLIILSLRQFFWQPETRLLALWSLRESKCQTVTFQRTRLPSGWRQKTQNWRCQHVLRTRNIARHLPSALKSNIWHLKIIPRKAQTSINVYDSIFGASDCYIEFSALGKGHVPPWGTSPTNICPNPVQASYQNQMSTNVLYSCVGLLTYFHPWKLTWQWKNNNLKMYPLLNMVIFDCHVSFRESTYDIEYCYRYIYI